MYSTWAGGSVFGDDIVFRGAKRKQDLRTRLLSRAGLDLESGTLRRSRRQAAWAPESRPDLAA